VTRFLGPAVTDVYLCVSAPGRNDEDELYEAYIVETNLVYRLADDRLQVAEEYSGSVLKYAMLRSKEVCSHVCLNFNADQRLESLLNRESATKASPHRAEAIL